jgi:hypothetical protein
MVNIESIFEEVVVKVMGRASRKNEFRFISMDRDCTLDVLNGVLNEPPNLGKGMKVSS